MLPPVPGSVKEEGAVAEDAAEEEEDEAEEEAGAAEEEEEAGGAAAFGFLHRGGLSNVKLYPSGQVGSTGGAVPF